MRRREGKARWKLSDKSERKTSIDGPLFKTTESGEKVKKPKWTGRVKGSFGWSKNCSKNEPGKNLFRVHAVNPLEWEGNLVGGNQRQKSLDLPRSSGARQSISTWGR